MQRERREHIVDLKVDVMSQKKLLDLITVHDNLIDELDDPDAKHAIEELADKLVPLEEEIAREPDAAITILPGGWVIVNGFTNLSLAMTIRAIAQACGLEKYLPRAVHM